MMTSDLIFAMKTFTTFVQSLALGATLTLVPASLAATQEAPAPTASPEDQPAADKPEGEAKEGEAKEGEATPDAPPVAEADTSSGPASTTLNLVYKMRQQVKLIDEKFAQITSPSPSLKSLIKSRKSRIEYSLERIEQKTADLAEVQEAYNQTNTGAYAFQHETSESRFKYTNEGQAAYKAMINDLKDRSIARKVMGLNKFETYAETFKGIEGYEEAYRIYTSSIVTLNKKWAKVLEAEKKKRERYNDVKIQSLEESEAREIERYEKKAEAAGYNLNKDWFNPSLKNIQMLEMLVTKSSRMVREFENKKKDKPQAGIGCTPDILETFWKKMDEAREMMVSGNLDGGKEFLEKDPAFNALMRLSRDIFPEEYCAPIREEYRDLQTEMRKRATEKRRLQYSLERETNLLEREVDAAQSQIDAVLEELEKELALQNEGDEDEGVKMTEEDRIKASEDADADAEEGEEDEKK